MPRILLIAPDPRLADALQRAIVTEGVSFELAAGRADALTCLRRSAADVVITSPVTTIEENLALFEEIRQVCPGAKTILLAPQATPEDVIAALRAHVFACFAAPFDPTEIAAMVTGGLEQADRQDGIEVLSAKSDWISLRVHCHLLTAERVVRFLSELPTDLREGEQDELMLAFREVLLNAMEHGAGFDPEKVIDVAAVRTERTLVYYIRDPGPGFRRDALDHAAVTNPAGDPLAHLERRAEQGMRPGGFGLLLVRKIVDELIYNETGNEVLLIKHTPKR